MDQKNSKMERAELSEVYLSVCNWKANEKAYQKFGPFSCPSELSGLVKCLPKLFETDDVQVGDLQVRVKMPRWTGERNLLIVDLPPDKNGEIAVFAIDNLPAGGIKVFDIPGILTRTTGQLHVLAGRVLRKIINGEEVDIDLSDKECCLNGGILIIRSALLKSPVQDTLPPMPPLDANPSLVLKSPPAESLGRGAQLRLDTVEDTEIKKDQSDTAPRVSEKQPLTFVAQYTSETDENSIGDACIDDSSGSSSPLIMPPEFKPILSSYTYDSDSMEKFPEGQQEVSRTARSIELPTAKDICDSVFKDEDAREIFEEAYYESFEFTFRERGGWIFVDRNDPTQLEVVLAPISASESFCATDTTTTPSIDLNNIPTDVPSGFILVATFHTHPLNDNKEPSKADFKNAYYRGMPGIVISRTKIFGYGPERRTNTAEPLKYAPPMEENGSLKPRKLRDNTFSLPYIPSPKGSCGTT